MILWQYIIIIIIYELLNINNLVYTYLKSFFYSNELE